MAFLDADWCGLAWTPFIHFGASRAEFRAIPTGAGLYRVRVAGAPKLAYIGQTGRGLRQRLRGLRQNTLKAECPFNDPHTAAPKLWSYRDADGLEYECSAAAVDLPDAERCAMECWLLWHYRSEAGASTLCNFGRLHPRYRTSANRKTGDRGGRLPGQSCNPLVGPSMPPLKGPGPADEAGWMGMAWSELAPLIREGATTAPAGPGVYKLLDAATREMLYIGESASLRQRLVSHSGRDWGGRAVVMAHAALSGCELACQRLEIESDLIAGPFRLQPARPRFPIRREGHGDRRACRGDHLKGRDFTWRGLP